LHARPYGCSAPSVPGLYTPLSQHLYYAVSRTPCPCARTPLNVCPLPRQRSPDRAVFPAACSAHDSRVPGAESGGMFGAADKALFGMIRPISIITLPVCDRPEPAVCRLALIVHEKRLSETLFSIFLMSRETHRNLKDSAHSATMNQITLWGRFRWHGVVLNAAALMNCRIRSAPAVMHTTKSSESRMILLRIL